MCWKFILSNLNRFFSFTHVQCVFNTANTYSFIKRFVFFRPLSLYKDDKLKNHGFSDFSNESLTHLQQTTCP